jgi:O-Antigen ligase
MLSVSRVLLLAGPTALAFFAGGYFQGPRSWAGAGVWAAVLLGLAAGARPPRGREALITLGGLALLAAWTLLSIVWAPVQNDAYQAGQIAVLYVGGLLGSSLVLRGRTLIEFSELALAAGTLVVIGYGLAGRVVPGILSYATVPAAEGRLNQPLTYWNAMGELAAIGLVLVARIAGDVARPRALRAAAVAAAAPLGVGLYLSVSRGALFAYFAGLVALVTIVRGREQLRAVVWTVAIAAIASAATSQLGGFASLEGTLAHRETQGIIAFVIIVVVAGLGVAGTLAWAGAEDRPLALPRHSSLLATGLIVAGLAVAIVVGAHEREGTVANGTSSRLASLSSDRYAYWSVAIRAFRQEPLHGVGAGNWNVYWLRWRHLTESAQDAHSLPLQVLAELGVVGIVLLAIFVVGLALAARRALAHAPQTAGAAAALVAYFAHAPLDWDWQMPAVTLVAIVLAGIVLAAASERPAALRGDRLTSATTG